MFSSGIADMSAAYVIGKFHFPQDYVWSVSEQFDPGSAIAEEKVAQIISGFSENFRDAVRIFMEMVRTN